LKKRDISHSSILALIGECQDDIDRLWHARGGLVVLGPRQLQDVKYEIFTHPVSFDSELRLKMTCEERICNIRVCCLPWFDGVVIIPNDMMLPKEEIDRWPYA